MSRLKLNQIYIIDEHTRGKTLARIIDIKGWLFKRYDAEVWGINKSGFHEWPNGSVSSYINQLKDEEVKNARPYIPTSTKPIKKG